MAKDVTDRKKAALETKKRIIEAARKMVSEKGFEKVSVSDIAKEAGVATGSFYTYFKKKEDVIEEINKTDFYRLAGMVNQMDDKTVLEKVDNYCRVFMKVVEREGMEICRQDIKNQLSFSSVSPESELPKYLQGYQALQSILTKAAAKGQLRKDTPVKELAYLIHSQLYGLLLMWCMSDGKLEGSKHVGKYCRLCLEESLKAYLL